MRIVEHKVNDIRLAEITSENLVIQTVEDGINLLGNIYFQGYDALVLYKNNIISDFFDLKNGLAGEILQKFSTYNIRLAIVGDFSNYSSKSLNDFIYESNKTKHVSFVRTISDAIRVLTIL